MENTKVTYGSRIKFLRQGNLMTSHKIFTDGHTMVRIVINTDTKVFQLVDPVTGYVHFDGPKNLTNMEVVQRNAKKALVKLLNISFEKEVRKDESVSE